MRVANTQAYYDAAKITAVKCFIVQAQGDINTINHVSKLQITRVSLCFSNNNYTRVEHLKDALLG